MQESTTLNRATDNERYANRLSVQKKKQSLNPLIFISCLSLIELLSLILSFFSSGVISSTPYHFESSFIYSWRRSKYHLHQKDNCKELSFLNLSFQARIQKKNEPPQNFPVSQFYPIFPRFFTNKNFQGSQVRTLR